MADILLFGTSISLYEAFLFFFLYSFLGWVCEVIFAAFKTKKFVNRGFLSGPICPLYGVGALLVMLCCDTFIDKWWAVFLISTILTTAIEFLTGLILEHQFRRKWWDYSNRKFNILGYVCLRFSLLWGILCTAVVLLFNKPFYFLFEKMNPQVGLVLIGIFSLILIVDIILAVIDATKYCNRFKYLELLQQEIKRTSDYIGQGIFNSYETINSKYNQTLEKLKSSRLSKAFPNLIKHIKNYLNDDESK